MCTNDPATLNLLANEFVKQTVHDLSDSEIGKGHRILKFQNGNESLFRLQSGNESSFG